MSSKEYMGIEDDRPMKKWIVIQHTTVVDEVFFVAGMLADEVKRSLIDHDGYSHNIEVFSV